MQINVVYGIGEFIVGTLTLFINTVLLITIAQSPSLHTVDNVFVTNLAIADITVGIFVGPITVYLLAGYADSYKCCAILKSIILSCTNASILAVMAITLEKFVAVKTPMLYNTVKSIKKSFILCFCLWVIGSLSASILFEWSTEDHEIKRCDLRDLVSKDLLLFFHIGALRIFPLVIMISSYTYIYMVVRRHTIQTNKLHYNLRHSFGEKGTVVDEEENFATDDRRVALKFVSIISIYIVCWTPISTLKALTFFCPKACEYPEELIAAADLVTHLHSAANPFLYAISTKRIRRAIVNRFWKDTGVTYSGHQLNVQSIMAIRRRSRMTKKGGSAPCLSSESNQRMPSSWRPGPQPEDEYFSESYNNTAGLKMPE